MAEAKRVHTNEEDQEYASMGARLRQAREYLGLSQEAVAEALGVPRASVSAMESGRRKVSSLELRDRATKNLTQEDREQVLRFAEFLKGAGQAPARRRSP